MHILGRDDPGPSDEADEGEYERGWSVKYIKALS